MAGTGEYDKHYPDKVSPPNRPPPSQLPSSRSKRPSPLTGRCLPRLAAYRSSRACQGVYECAGCGTPLYTADMSESARPVRIPCARLLRRILRTSGPLYIHCSCTRLLHPLTCALSQSSNPAAAVRLLVPFAPRRTRHPKELDLLTCRVSLLPAGPAFFDAIPGAITEITDRSWGMERTEIVCSKCGGHQGHVFRNEGFREVPFAFGTARAFAFKLTVHYCSQSDFGQALCQQRVDPIQPRQAGQVGKVQQGKVE